MESKYVKSMVILVFIFMVGVIVIGITAINEKERLQKEIDKKQELIESQVRMIIDLNNRCDKCDKCDWLQSFYDEFHEQVGAYE